MSTMNLIIHAARIARIAHGGQMRKFTGEPYIVHPARVAGKVGLYAEDEKVVAAAYLHDVLEDTAFTYKDLLTQVGIDTAFLVWELTNPSKGLSLNRADRKALDRKFLSERSPEARLIKIIDRIDNLSDMVQADGGFRRLYADESMALLEVIKPGLPSELVREFEKKAETLRGTQG